MRRIQVAQPHKITGPSTPIVVSDSGTGTEGGNDSRLSGIFIDIPGPVGSHNGEWSFKPAGVVADHCACGDQFDLRVAKWRIEIQDGDLEPAAILRQGDDPGEVLISTPTNSPATPHGDGVRFIIPDRTFTGFTLRRKDLPQVQQTRQSKQCLDIGFA